MKLKVVVVDLEVPPAAKHWLLRLGIPALVLGAAAVAYAGVPITFKSNALLKADDLNTNFSALDARLAALEGTRSGFRAELTNATHVPNIKRRP
jgi:hypothetical protein